MLPGVLHTTQNNLPLMKNGNGIVQLHLEEPEDPDGHIMGFGHGIEEREKIFNQL